MNPSSTLYVCCHDNNVINMLNVTAAQLIGQNQSVFSEKPMIPRLAWNGGANANITPQSLSLFCQSNSGLVLSQSGGPGLVLIALPVSLSGVIHHLPLTQGPPAAGTGHKVACR